MCGRAYSPRMLYMWPNSRISVMGGDQAAGVMSTLMRDNMEKKGKEWYAEEEAAFKKPVSACVLKFSGTSRPFFTFLRSLVCRFWINMRRKEVATTPLPACGTVHPFATLCQNEKCVVDLACLAVRWYNQAKRHSRCTGLVAFGRSQWSDFSFLLFDPLHVSSHVLSIVCYL